MYRKRIQKAWGHTAHRGWARLLLDRARDLITHGPAHRGANGAAMPTDEDDQDGRFFYNHPERGASSLPRRAEPLLLLLRSNPPPLRGGLKKESPGRAPSAWLLVATARCGAGRLNHVGEGLVF